MQMGLLWCRTLDPPQVQICPQMGSRFVLRSCQKTVQICLSWGSDLSQMGSDLSQMGQICLRSDSELAHIIEVQKRKKEVLERFIEAPDDEV